LLSKKYIKLDNKFDDLRPYNDNEVNNGLKKIVENKYFPAIVKYLFPERTVQEVIDELLQVHSAFDFQKKFMHGAIRSIVKQTSDGLSFGGFENLKLDESYLFIANHRDILLDSAIMQVLLVEHGLETSEISFGSNLMMNPFVIEAGKVNRMFKVERSINSKESLLMSKKLSEYILHTITEKHLSVWIAHRKGRAKNGFDKTDTVILKMLEMANNNDFTTHFKTLKLIPVTISYEYEPCGKYKVNELYQSLSSQYVKKPGEDLNSILKGITEYKGRIHLQMGTPIVQELDILEEIKNKNEKYKILSELVDTQIYQNYKLWPTNYIAYDLLTNENKFPKNYTKSEKEKFITIMNSELDSIKINNTDSVKIYLEMYANPVKNC